MTSPSHRRHPDDEDTSLLSALSRGVGAETADSAVAALAGLAAADFDRSVPGSSFLGGGQDLKELLLGLKETYCRSIGVEYMHIQDPEERRWLQNRMEPIQNQLQIESAEKMTILKRLYQTALFEAYLNKKYMGVTRFSLE